MGRETTFYPETERNRDLLYSEYTSCDRSVHVLIQDNGIESYRFLLDAYRDIVAHYLSFDPIEPPVSFLRYVARQLEAHAESARFSIEDFQTIGLYVLLRGADAYYLLASRDDHTFLHGADRVSRLRNRSDAVDVIELGDREAQENLFPQRITDSMAVYRIDAHGLDGHDLVVGCGEEDKGAVLEWLDDPVASGISWGADAGQKKAVSSRFITRKVLAVSLDAEGMVPARDAARPDRAGSRRAVKRLAFVASAAIVALVGALWARQAWVPSLKQEETAAKQAPAKPEETEALSRSIAPEYTPPPSGNSEPPSAHDPTRERAFEDGWAIEFSSPVTSSPTVFESAVVFGCRDSSVYAVDHETGQTRWRYRTADGVGASPVTLGALVIGADYQGNVFGLDAGSGAVAWSRRLPGKVVSSPCVAGGRVVIGCYDGNVYCLDGRSGNPLWKQACGARVRADLATDGVRFFVPSYNGSLYALSGETGRELWRYTVGGNLSGGAVHSGSTVYVGGPDGRLHAVSAETGKPDWVSTVGGALKSSVAVGAGRVYVGSNDYHVYCVDASSGKTLWKFETGGIVLSAPTLHDEVLFVGSYDGVLYCLDGATGAVLDRVDSNGEIYSSPAVIGNNIYFGNNKGRFLRVDYKL